MVRSQGLRGESGSKQGLWIPRHNMPSTTHILLAKEVIGPVNIQRRKTKPPVLGRNYGHTLQRVGTARKEVAILGTYFPQTLCFP